MRRFGFIFHPLDMGLYADGFNEPGIKKKRLFLMQQVIRWFPPMKRSTVTGIRSMTGDEIEGDMILVSLLPEQILKLESGFVMKKIIEAGKIAQDLGDNIVGLGAYASQVGRKGVHIARGLNIPVTTGSSYTIAVAIDATLIACRKVGIDIKGARVCVIGATGAIGSICTKTLASYKPRKMTIVARNLFRLKRLASAVGSGWPDVDVCVSRDIQKATGEADVMIIATNTPSAIVDVENLKPGTIVCDVSSPRNISMEAMRLRQDVLVIDGGIIQPPGEVDFHFSFGLPPGMAYACMAETMILTFEGLFENYSLGGNITLEKVQKIQALAMKHGFKLARLRSFGHEITPQQMEKVRITRVSKAGR